MMYACKLESVCGVDWDESRRPLIVMNCKMSRRINKSFASEIVIADVQFTDVEDKPDNSRKGRDNLSFGLKGLVVASKADSIINIHHIGGYFQCWSWGFYE
jgi:hypothetical protein